jgi:hypothetical protein
LKTGKQNINLREFFREKLEFAEVIPDAQVRLKLMRRVAIKEFMHFNPERLNIYYLGGILITVITAAVLLFAGSENSNRSNSISISAKFEKSDIGSYVEVPLEQPIRLKPDSSNVVHNKSIRSNITSQLPEKSKSESSKATESRENSVSFPSSINNSFSKNSLFTEITIDTKKLQSGFKADESLIDPSATVGCAPMKVRFHINLASYDSCIWIFGDGGYSSQRDPEWIFDVEGEYKVVVEVFSHNGENISATASVTVHPRPQVHFEIVSEKAASSGNNFRFLNYSTNASQFRWDFGDGSTSEFFEPTHTYTKFSNYNVRLVAFSDWGCSDSLTIFNAFSGSDYFIDFPNAFIPNVQGPSGGYYSRKSDEAAQVFHPSYSGVSDYQLKIFSKLGIPIFESNDINLGWDGYNNGQLSEPGVYIWKVRGKFRNGEPFIKMGDVTLLKN